MKIMGVAAGELVSGLAGLLFLWSTVKQFLPCDFEFHIQKFFERIIGFFFPYMHVTFQEYSAEGWRNEAYTFIKNYLGAKSVKKAEYLKADMYKNSKSLEISLDEGDEIIDEFKNVKIKWRAYKKIIRDNESRNGMPFEKRYYMLRVHSRFRDFAMGEYMKHVVEEGKAIQFKKRKRMLHTNNKEDDWYWKGGRWSCINFQHPATFDTLGMDPQKKEEIMDDLDSFRKGKDYYAKIGKAWKRGYLLYGPPGTGKTTMIAAIANFLDYDIYDLELTSVKENAELKQLLIETNNKSIIVIEDIDCSLDLTGKRKNKREISNDTGEEKNNSADSGDKKQNETEGKKSNVTLSGLLNFIDGIWSACGEERVIIFTTNHVERLDPALIRRGRMDVHIEMSYCRFEAFKVLAKNYLDIDSHPLFEDIRKLLERANMSPCDVAESLIPRRKSRDDVENCLMKLIEAIKARDEILSHGMSQDIKHCISIKAPGKSKRKRRGKRKNDKSSADLKH